MKRKDFFLGCFLAALSLFFLAGPAAAAAEIHMKIATVVGPPHPWIDGANYFIQKVAERSGGKIEVTLFDRGRLGADSSVLKALRDGTVDLHIGGSANAATYVPELSFFNLGYLYRDEAQFERSLQVTSPVFKEFAKIIEGKGLGFKVLSLTGGGVRNVSNRLRPITKVEDLKGMKFRVPGGTIPGRFWKALGTLPVSLPWTEIYSALQTDVVDGFESTVPGYDSSKLYEVAKFHSMTEHEFMLSVFLMSERSFKKLSPEMRKMVEQTGAEAGDLIMKAGVTQTAAMLEELKAKGAIINPVDKSGFIKLALPLQDQEAKEMGLTEVLKTLRETK